MSTTTSGGDGGALYWAHRYEGERDEWRRCAEEIFRAAVKVERERDSYQRAFNCAKELLARHDGECERLAGERDESDAVASMLSACLLDAERECDVNRSMFITERAWHEGAQAMLEEQAAEIVALRNRLDAEQSARAEADDIARRYAERSVRNARACHSAGYVIIEAQEAAADYHAAWQDAEEAAADYHAAWQDAEERIATLTRNGERIVAECHSCGELSCGTAEEARAKVLEHLRECPVHPIRQVERERDDADRALSMERAAHWATAGRLEEAEKRLDDTCRAWREERKWHGARLENLRYNRRWTRVDIEAMEQKHADDVLAIAAECAAERKAKEEARKVAAVEFRTAKRHHAAKWGDANADIAFKAQEEAHPWLLD